MNEPYYRVITAGARTRLSNVAAPGFPIIISPMSGLHEAAFAYLCELTVIAKRASGSVADAAGIICIWFNHLATLSRSWSQPCPDAFRRWARDENNGANEARRRRRANVVFKFYEYTTWGPDNNWIIAAFVDELAAPVRAEILESGKKISRRLALEFDTDRPSMRPVPSLDEVGQIADFLRGSEHSYLGVRNWHLVKTAVATNLRMQGLEQLRVMHINKMLMADGVINSSESVELIQTADRVRIRRSLESLRYLNRENLVCQNIKEKGKLRDVMFPIETIEEILDYIWEERERLLSGAQRKFTRAKANGALWISTKTGRALHRGSIADILALGFEGASVAGSGHRFRATHCVLLFRKLLHDAKKNHGGRYDAEALLEHVAQRMGHKEPETLRPYLNATALEVFG